MVDRTVLPSRTPPGAWLDALARARADVAAGRTHALDDVLRELEAEAEDMEAGQRLRGSAPAG